MQTLIDRKKGKATGGGDVPQHWETTIAKGEQRTMEEYVVCDLHVTSVTVYAWQPVGINISCR